MKRDLLEKSLLSGKLHLNFWNSVDHYFIVIFLTFVALLPFGFNIYHGDFSFSTYSLTNLIIFGPLAILFAWLQNRRLNFRILKTDLERPDLTQAIYSAAKQLEWLIIEHTDKYIIARTFPSPWSGSWGEQITILMNGDKVLINSICDPKKPSSIVSFGRNKNNVETAIKEIENAEANRH